MQEYIERKFLLSKLDSALLFFSSSLSLAFGIGYALLGMEWLRFYLPMLLLGWFMPIYVGYVRGSILLDSVEERIRGWFYFIVGLGFYIIGPLFQELSIRIFGSNSYVAILVELPMSIVFGYGLAYLLKTIIVHIFKIRYEDMRKEAKEALSETMMSAVLLASLLSLTSRFDLSKFSRSLDFMLLLQVISILVQFLILLLVIVCERKSRKLLRIGLK